VSLLIAKCNSASAIKAGSTGADLVFVGVYQTWIVLNSEMQELVALQH
jgi:hypothetical protein